MQRIYFLGMELDSVNQTARLTQEHTELPQDFICVGIQIASSC